MHVRSKKGGGNSGHIKWGRSEKPYQQATRRLAVRSNARLQRCRVCHSTDRRIYPGNDFLESWRAGCLNK